MSESVVVHFDSELGLFHLRGNKLYLRGCHTATLIGIDSQERFRFVIDDPSLISGLRRFQQIPDLNRKLRDIYLIKERSLVAEIVGDPSLRYKDLLEIRNIESKYVMTFSGGYRLELHFDQLSDNLIKCFSEACVMGVELWEKALQEEIARKTNGSVE